jgi:hypothetical protein
LALPARPAPPQPEPIARISDGSSNLPLTLGAVGLGTLALLGAIVGPELVTGRARRQAALAARGGPHSVPPSAARGA